MSQKYLYRCSDCNRTYSVEGIFYLCPECSAGNTIDSPPKGVLNIEYDYGRISSQGARSEVYHQLEKEQFLSLLPIDKKESLPQLKVGNTPLYKHREKNNAGESIDVFLKDDSQNPTFSFKDRASALVSAWAKEHGIDTIVAASTGNAGSSLAGICASQGQKSVIFVPASAPLAKLTQIMLYGARIIPVQGNYDQAFDLSIRASAEFGFYNRNTAFNPLTIEGKKTVSFELFGQMGQILPDRVFVPVGDGVIISGVYKGFEDLLKLGIIDHMPVIVAVQAEGSSNLIANLNTDSFVVKPGTTLADSISVDIPRNFRMAAGYLKKYKGETIIVSDEDILDASLALGRKYGIFSEPAASAAYAGFQKFNSTIGLNPGSRNVVLLTGSGLKDLKSVQSRLSLPLAVSPEIENLGSLFSK